MNKEIRRAMADAKVYQWQVAKQIGISEYTLCRWFREELQGERREQVLSAIEQLKGVKKHDE